MHIDFNRPNIILIENNRQNAEKEKNMKTFQLKWNGG